MTEVRFHGRFGQPVGKLARAVGQYALKQGKNVQVFDAFAPFRTGGPMYSVVRVADEPIRERSANNTKPDLVVVLDNSLFGGDVTKGLKASGCVMALGVDQSVLGDNSFSFQQLDPYFTPGSTVETNIVNALEAYGFFK
ncbi:MAG TPA: 2-oxoacid:acceptor oxidoreductase family protein [Verrucomicrobiae bacterium]|nr:2-oxoacid:acceptor oxidoreductase family protein [Verrucomicrobiae bacterium]